MDILFEYSKLLSLGLGDGESACLAFARFRKNYISSSNLRDVSEYCKLHSIRNIPTMKLLEIAEIKGIMNVEEINTFLEQCFTKGQRLPSRTWEDYKKRY